ncbi:hypothetical protein DCAR_0520247 [Daucus carota subsp. sativus]|uniref:Large ribosomal subunit protein uL15/eL18 domain-containing protein n=1 Tax=Daucus carota subsp. sativus TaxID=79200 RepID=A0AAF0X6W0_DAUCS|nr:hypothetical protein DCAR_0520247 [Daucus carota subsp. sativus]
MQFAQDLSTHREYRGYGAEQGNKVLDVTQFGYFKVLGKDSGTKPIVVKAKLVSKIAEKKIEMGGAVVLTA